MKYLLSMIIFICFLAFIFLPSDLSTPKVENTPKPSISPKIHTVIDTYEGVNVYHNGGISNTHGRHLTQDGYNLGLKWQCVEFVKRFYYQRFDHKMPDSYGHAKDFFDNSIGNGFNQKRNLNQYRNGGIVAPKKNMIIVFKGNEQNPFGHIAIVSKVLKDEIEVVQQNWGTQSRMRLPLFHNKDGFLVGHTDAIGWLSL